VQAQAHQLVSTSTRISNSQKDSHTKLHLTISKDPYLRTPEKATDIHLAGPGTEGMDRGTHDLTKTCEYGHTRVCVCVRSEVQKFEKHNPPAVIYKTSICVVRQQNAQLNSLWFTDYVAHKLVNE
jgi:hypothetical protein